MASPVPWGILFGSANEDWLFTIDQMLCSEFRGSCKSDPLLTSPSYKPPNTEPCNSQYVPDSLGALYISAQATCYRNSDIQSKMSLPIWSVFCLQLRKKNASSWVISSVLRSTDFWNVGENYI